MSADPTPVSGRVTPPTPLRRARIAIEEAGNPPRHRPHWVPVTLETLRALVDAVEASAEIASYGVDDIDSRLRYVVVQPDREEWTEFVAKMRAVGAIE